MNNHKYFTFFQESRIDIIRYKCEHYTEKGRKKYFSIFDIKSDRVMF